MTAPPEQPRRRHPRLSWLSAEEIARLILLFQECAGTYMQPRPRLFDFKEEEYQHPRRGFYLRLEGLIRERRLAWRRPRLIELLAECAEHMAASDGAGEYDTRRRKHSGELRALSAAVEGRYVERRGPVWALTLSTAVIVALAVAGVWGQFATCDGPPPPTGAAAPPFVPPKPKARRIAEAFSEGMLWVDESTMMEHVCPKKKKVKICTSPTFDYRSLLTGDLMHFYAMAASCSPRPGCVARLIKLSRSDSHDSEKPGKPRLSLYGTKRGAAAAVDAAGILHLATVYPAHGEPPVGTDGDERYTCFQKTRPDNSITTAGHSGKPLQTVYDICDKTKVPSEGDWFCHAEFGPGQPKPHQRHTREANHKQYSLGADPWGGVLTAFHGHAGGHLTLRWRRSADKSPIDDEWTPERVNKSHAGYLAAPLLTFQPTPKMGWHAMIAFAGWCPDSGANCSGERSFSLSPTELDEEPAGEWQEVPNREKGAFPIDMIRWRSDEALLAIRSPPKEPEKRRIERIEESFEYDIYPLGSNSKVNKKTVQGGASVDLHRGVNGYLYAVTPVPEKKVDDRHVPVRLDLIHISAPDVQPELPESPKWRETTGEGEPRSRSILPNPTGPIRYVSLLTPTSAPLAADASVVRGVAVTGRRYRGEAASALKAGERDGQEMYIFEWRVAPAPAALMQAWRSDSGKPLDGDKWAGGKWEASDLVRIAGRLECARDEEVERFGDISLPCGRAFEVWYTPDSTNVEATAIRGAVELEHYRHFEHPADAKGANGKLLLGPCGSDDQCVTGRQPSHGSRDRLSFGEFDLASHISERSGDDGKPELTRGRALVSRHGPVRLGDEGKTLRGEFGVTHGKRFFARAGEVVRFGGPLSGEGCEVALRLVEVRKAGEPAEPVEQVETAFDPGDPKTHFVRDFAAMERDGLYRLEFERSKACETTRLDAYVERFGPAWGVVVADWVEPRADEASPP